MAQTDARFPGFLWNTGKKRRLQPICGKDFGILLDVDYNDFAQLGQIWNLKEMENTMNQNLSVLISELKNRAHIYIHIYRELSREVGKAKAAEIMKRALYARGKEKGLLLAGRLGEPNLHKMALAFMEGKVDMDAFGHEIVQEHSDFILLRLNRCPLVEAWTESGLSPEEQKVLCDMAYQVDFGKFEAAGYKLAFTCRIADAGKSCDMKVTI